MAMMIDTLELGPIEILKIQRTADPGNDGATDILERAKALVSDGVGKMTVRLKNLHTKSGVRLIDLVFADEANKMEFEPVEDGEIKYHERFGLVRVIGESSADWFGHVVIIEPVRPEVLDSGDFFYHEEGTFCPPVDEVADNGVLEAGMTSLKDARVPQEICVHISELMDLPKLRKSDELYAILRGHEEPAPTIEEFYHVLLTSPWGTSLVMGCYSHRLLEMPTHKLASLKDGKSPESDPKVYIPWIRRGTKIWKEPVKASQVGVTRIQGTLNYQAGGTSRVILHMADGKAVKVNVVNELLPTNDCVPMPVIGSLENPLVRLACQWVDFYQQKKRLYGRVR